MENLEFSELYSYNRAITSDETLANKLVSHPNGVERGGDGCGIRPAATWSPDGLLLACAVKHRLVIRDRDSLHLVGLMKCSQPIEQLSWSPDGNYVLCGAWRHGKAEIRAVLGARERAIQGLDDDDQDLDADDDWSAGDKKKATGGGSQVAQMTQEGDKEWRCTIRSGKLPLVFATWVPDSAHVIAIEDHRLRATVWSLSTMSPVAYINSPKFHSNRGLSFSEDGAYMAIVLRVDVHDEIAIYCCSSWLLVRQFRVESQDAEEICWLPGSGLLCVRDTPLQNSLFLYHPDGRIASQLSVDTEALGVVNFRVSPSANGHMAVGCGNEKLVVYNYFTERQHEVKVDSSLVKGEVLVYKELLSAAAEDDDEQDKPISQQPTLYKVSFSLSQRTAHAKSVSLKRANAANAIKCTAYGDEHFTGPLLQNGIAAMSFSSDGRYLACISAKCPERVWIFDLYTSSDENDALNPPTPATRSCLRLSVVLVQLLPVQKLAWHPNKNVLSLCTGSNKIYFWTSDGCSSAEVPAVNSFHVHDLLWNASKSDVCVCLLGNDKACCCYLVQ